ncbi:MAG TPA: methionine biosynthesis protein MetW [Rhabdaerophilum sp.]|nr:methionine biosynthesis protein MetW [Rhabdaerophilum sp.]
MSAILPPETLIRPDHRLVWNMIGEGTRVLDVGCGDGTLLDALARTKNVDARGIEISRTGVAACVAKGLAVIQGDADTDLADYPDDCFDFVVLSQTLQATFRPRQVLEQMLRIGRNAVVSFPNFGHWRMRRHLLLHGTMPVTEHLPDTWYNTPNIHFCTIRDFVELAEGLKARIVRADALDAAGRPVGVQMPWWFWNLMGEQGIFWLARGEARS